MTNVQATPAARSWTPDEQLRLQTFLSDPAQGLARAMSPSMIDGFFCALISAPRLVSPAQALRWVYDHKQGQQEPNFSSLEEAQAIVALLMQQWNAIATTWQIAPETYQPLLKTHRDASGAEIGVMFDWAYGFMRAVALDEAAWQPLLRAEPSLLQDLWLHGTAEGMHELKQTAPTPASHAEAVARLPEQLRQIHAHFATERALAARAAAEAQRQPLRRSPEKLGRNELCHCGSGRKYKLCHGAN